MMKKNKHTYKKTFNLNCDDYSHSMHSNTLNQDILQTLQI